MVVRLSERGHQNLLPQWVQFYIFWTISCSYLFLIVLLIQKMQYKMVITIYTTCFDETQLRCFVLISMYTSCLINFPSGILFCVCFFVSRNTWRGVRGKGGEEGDAVFCFYCGEVWLLTLEHCSYNTITKWQNMNSVSVSLLLLDFHLFSVKKFFTLSKRKLL